MGVAFGVWFVNILQIMSGHHLFESYTVVSLESSGECCHVVRTAFRVTM